MSTQSEAIRRYMAARGLRQTDVAEVMGVAKQTVCNILSGRYPLSKDNALKLSKAYGFDVAFLLTGEGSLLPSSTQSVGQGAILNGGTVQGGINIGAQNAALIAENERLRDEVAWLREQLQKKS